MERVSRGEAIDLEPLLEAILSDFEAKEFDQAAWQSSAKKLPFDFVY